MKKLISFRWRILTLILLLAGLAVGVYLVQQRQLLEKRAEENLYSAFEVTGPEGNPLNCSGDTCETNSLEVEIKVKDIEKLLGE